MTIHYCVKKVQMSSVGGVRLFHAPPPDPPREKLARETINVRTFTKKKGRINRQSSFSDEEEDVSRAAIPGRFAGPRAVWHGHWARVKATVSWMIPSDPSSWPGTQINLHNNNIMFKLHPKQDLQTCTVLARYYAI